MEVEGELERAGRGFACYWRSAANGASTFKGSYVDIGETHWKALQRLPTDLGTPNTPLNQRLTACWNLEFIGLRVDPSMFRNAFMHFGLQSTRWSMMNLFDILSARGQ